MQLCCDMRIKPKQACCPLISTFHSYCFPYLTTYYLLIYSFSYALNQSTYYAGKSHLNKRAFTLSKAQALYLCVSIFLLNQDISDIPLLVKAHIIAPLFKTEEHLINIEYRLTFWNRCWLVVSKCVVIYIASPIHHFTST